MSNYNPKIHHRKSYRLPGYDYSKPGYYFVTICLRSLVYMLTIQNRNYLELTSIGEIAQQYWREIPDHFPHVLLDEYVFMPDHIHGIIIIRKRFNEIVDKINTKPDFGSYRRSIVGTFHGCNVGRFHGCNVGTFHETSLQWTHDTSTKSNNTKNNKQKKSRKKYMSSISPKRGSLPVIMRSYTGSVKRWCNKNGARQFRWQSRYFDHIIRNRRELFIIRKYIKNNPKKMFERVKNIMCWEYTDKSDKTIN